MFIKKGFKVLCFNFLKYFNVGRPAQNHDSEMHEVTSYESAIFTLFCKWSNQVSRSSAGRGPRTIIPTR